MQMWKMSVSGSHKMFGQNCVQWFGIGWMLDWLFKGSNSLLHKGNWIENSTKFMGCFTIGMPHVDYGPQVTMSH